jgi:hypothetical protein
LWNDHSILRDRNESDSDEPIRWNRSAGSG